MSNQGSSSEKDSAGRRAGFSRQDLLSQYQATDTPLQATSATPHHPSRPPNVSQPWITHQERFSVPSESATISSMGNKNDSDKTPSSPISTSASSSRNILVTSSDRREERHSEAIREGYESRTLRTIGPVEPHSSELSRYSSSYTTTTHSLGTLPQVVPLVTPAALADMGHLYKLPISGSSSSHLQLYSSEMFSQLHTPITTNAPQYPSYMSPSTVKVTTVPTYSPYLAGYPLGYPLVATQGSVGPYPTVESYSAMLASMGSQVQQAQGTRVPVSTYLPPGIIPLPYGSQLASGVPGLGLVPKEAVQESMPAIAYINQPVTAPDILRSGQPVLTSFVPVSGSMIGFPPRIDDEPNRLSQSQDSEGKQTQRTTGTPQLLKTTGDERNSHRESDTSLFQRPGFSSQLHVTLESGVHPASIHKQSEQDRKPRGMTSIVYESTHPNGSQSQDLPRAVPGKQEQSTHTVERYHDVGSLVPYQHESSTNFYPTGPPTVQHLPHVRFHLSPSPQVRPSPAVTHTVTTETPSTHIDATSTPTPCQMMYLLQTAGQISHPQEQLPASPSLNVDRSTLGPAQLPVSSFSNIPSYFTQGSVIQLASGELKRVEDIQTEDFIQSAEMCEGLKIDSSTVVRISEHADNGVALISFLVGEHKAQVSLEAPMEHPFFVFGQGWSAVRPERSLKSYSLGCHKLAVGDVCVSLTVKDKNGRWLYQPRQFEQPLLQQLQQQQQQQSHELQQQQQKQQQLSPMQTMFPGRKEPPCRSPEPKRQRTLEPVQELAVEWAQETSQQPQTSWVHGHQQHLQSDNRSVISTTVPGKITEQIDSNANMVLVPPTDTLAEERLEKPHARTDAKPLQPLKRRWSDPMHRAQLAAEQGKYPLSTKSSD